MDTFGLILLGLAAFIGLFLFMRVVNLWYFKIDDKIALQERTNELLEKLIKQNEKVEE